MTVYFRGKPACACLAAWLPPFEAELKRRGVIKNSIDIAQLIGGAAASAGTHSQGGAADIWQHDPVTQLVAREMGAAAWNRTTGSFANNQHTHLVLNGCEHNGPARYQIAALADGYNGLGAGGRGGRDTGPGPQRLRTWSQGIVWARDQAGTKRYGGLKASLRDMRVAWETARRQGDTADRAAIGEQMRATRDLYRKLRRR